MKCPPHDVNWPAAWTWDEEAPPPGRSSCKPAKHKSKGTVTTWGLHNSQVIQYDKEYYSQKPMTFYSHKRFVNKLFSSDITTLLPICFVVVMTLVKQTWLKLSVTPTLYSERRLRHSPCSSAADLCRWSSLLRSLFPPGFLETAAQAPDSPAPA